MGAQSFCWFFHKAARLSSPLSVVFFDYGCRIGLSSECCVMAVALASPLSVV